MADEPFADSSDQSGLALCLRVRGNGKIGSLGKHYNTPVTFLKCLAGGIVQCCGI